MLGILSTIMALYGVGMAGGATAYAVGSSLKSSASNKESALVKIFPRNKKSPAGEAELRYSFYYETDKKYTASVVCKKLKATKFIMEDTMSSMEERIEQVFADFDKRAAEI